MQKKKSKFHIKGVSDKLQSVVKLVGAILFLTPLVWTGIKFIVPYFQFVGKGPDLVNSVEILEQGLLVTNSALSADMENIDSIIYKIYWKDHKYTGRLKKSRSGNNYVFVKDGKLGVQIFGVYYDYNEYMWYFYDFNNGRIDLKNE